MGDVEFELDHGVDVSPAPVTAKRSSDPRKRELSPAASDDADRKVTVPARGGRRVGAKASAKASAKGSADCKDCANAVFNLGKVAKEQNCEAWFDEEVKDPERRLKMVRNYNVRCPVKEEGRRDKFSNSDYKRQALV